MADAEYHKCGKPDCFRKVSLSSVYCCHSCATAAGAPAPYEVEPYMPGVHWVHVHSEQCEARNTLRGEYDPRLIP